MKKQFLLSLFVFCLFLFSFSQPDRWQQRIKYNIDVVVDDENNQFKGTEKIEYINNSPDTLNRVFFHLYWNAFQPNSSMDVRSRELGKIYPRKDKNGNDMPDWDTRVTDRISKLKPNEIGYQKVKSVTINGKQQKLVEHETILEVVLDKNILPKSKTIIEVVFEAQVPIQVRRSGRDNAEQIRFSMAQWYPKVVEYDYKGWNANPYVGREFYGVWGDFDVKITIDKTYMLAATGVLQNYLQIGMGYAPQGYRPPRNNAKTLTWNFKAENVHDFVWAADQGYAHLSKEVRKDLTLHVFYKATTDSNDSAWNNVLWVAEKMLPVMEKRFGKYPYPQYSFIQGGDGGMEYAMATLLKGAGIGTVLHEWMHSWYQQILGSNESLYTFLDEGFTNWAENELSFYYNQNFLMQSPWLSNAKKMAEQKKFEEEKLYLPFKQADNYATYFALARSPYEEPLTTHADHFNTNFGHGTAVYGKGAVYINQLGYIVGDSVRDKILLDYYQQWKFKHPNSNDFIRVAEKTSGISLQWYNEYFINGIKTIDYAIGNIDIDETTKQPLITLKRIGKMPMPLDVLITYKDGTQELHYIPLNLMYGTKPVENNIKRFVQAEWRWTHPEYKLPITRKISEIKSIEIDPTYRMADINRNNNKLVIPD